MEEKVNTTTDAMQMYREKGPIGYWVKKANDTFTNVSRKTSEHGDFNRVEWQFLNIIYEKEELTISEITGLLDFFTDETGIDKLIKRFEAQNLIRINRHHVTITENGRQVHAEIVKIQEEIIRKALENVSPDAYKTSIETLETILKNLRPFTV